MKHPGRIRLGLAASLIVVAALSRLIPHPPNFTPVMAIALFGGVQFKNRWAAMLVPVLAMFMSDCFIGFHRLMPLVYALMAGVALIGIRLRHHPGISRVMAAAVGSSVGFYLTTNFAVWSGGRMYPHTSAGLITCYVAALPYLNNMILATALYCGLLFGGLAMAERRFPALCPVSQTANSGGSHP